jgi:hypothetical protein
MSQMQDRPDLPPVQWASNSVKPPSKRHLPSGRAIYAQVLAEFLYAGAGMRGDLEPAD